MYSELVLGKIRHLADCTTLALYGMAHKYCNRI